MLAVFPGGSPARAPAAAAAAAAGGDAAEQDTAAGLPDDVVEAVLALQKAVQEVGGALCGVRRVETCACGCVHVGVHECQFQRCSTEASDQTLC